MPAFTITTPSTAISLDKTGHGAATFTVTNQSGRSLRARATVMPIAPAPADWFTIDGAERDLPRDGSESFTVAIAAPSATEAGPRSFRLDIASVDRPDDEWAHGPVVGFDISDGLPFPPGYVETIIGALAGSVAGFVLVLVTGVLLWIASRLPADKLLPEFIPALSGSFVAAAALGGAIGIVAMLLLRAIPRPAPRDTAIVYVIATLVLGTVLAIVPAAFTTQPKAALVMQPQLVLVTQQPLRTDIAILQTFPPVQTGLILITLPPNVVITTFPPIVTFRPPSATATPIPNAHLTLPTTPTVTLPLVLIAALLAALLARASTRWREFAHL